MVASAVLAIIVVGGVAWQQARQSLIDASFERLTNVEQSKTRQIENYFDGVTGHLQQLTGDLTVVEATVRLNRSFDALALEPIPDGIEPTLEQYYTEQFLPRLDENSTGTPDFAVFEPSRQAAKQLQYLYVANNANALGVKHFLDDAGDGSDYSEWHARYHPGFRSLLEHSAYYDLFIIDIDTADIVYSVFKEADVGTNLLDGPYRNSGLAEAVRAVMAEPIRESVKIVDFKPYAPSYNAPASFVAAPVYNGDNPVGVLALQLPADEINDLMTSEENWRGEGMGESGETYLVGSDRLMRSDSRFLIENTDNFLNTIRATGTQSAVVDTIESFDSTILLQRIDSIAVTDAIAGESGAQTIVNYRGADVLSSYAPLDIAGLDWVIVSEIDQAEILAPVDRLLRRVLAASAIFVSLVALASAWIARRFMQPVRDAAAVADQLIEARGLTLSAANGDAQALSDTAFDGTAPGALGELGHRVNVLLGDADAERQSADGRYNEFLERMTRTMPWSAGERFRLGEHDAVDVGTRCFAIAVQLSPRDTTGDTVGDAGVAASIRFDDEIHALASQHGVDLFTHVGLEYVGIVGLTATYLDSVERAFAFANDVLRLGARSDLAIADSLQTRVALDVSAMRGAMRRESPYGYQVWGDAVRRAQELTHYATEATVCMTDEVYAQLVDHDTISHTGAASTDRDLSSGRVRSWAIELDSSVSSNLQPSSL